MRGPIGSSKARLVRLGKSTKNCKGDDLKTILYRVSVNVVKKVQGVEAIW